MNLTEIKNRLEKLNRYYDFLAAAPDNISKIDKDTFLMQLRELYDAVLFEAESPKLTKEVVPEVVPVKEEPVETAKEEKPIKKTTQFVFTNTEETPIKKEEPKAELKKEVEVKKEETPVVVEPKVEKKVEEKKEEPKAEVKKEVEVKKEETPVIVEPKVEKKEETEAKEMDENGYNDDFSELFVFKQATDLAAKLSESPIANLSQVLGLNEKFYYINELFGGDAVKFNQAIDYMNTVGDFAKARLYMEENLITQLGWMKKEKKNLAKDFIKLIRRRYL